MRVERVGRTRWLVGGLGAYSYFHPTRLFTGYVWDALTLGSLFAHAPVQSILILGLGGGTVARQCRHLLPDAHLVGVEIDRRVIDMARSEFALDATGVTVEHASAIDFLKRTRRRFDVIINDTFPIDATVASPGDNQICAATVRARLTDNGVYSSCVVDGASRRGAIPAAATELATGFRRLVHVRPPNGTSSALISGNDLGSVRKVKHVIRALPPPAARVLVRIPLIVIAQSADRDHTLERW